MTPRTLLALFLLAGGLAGCATITAPLSGQPMDTWQGTRTWPQKLEDQSIEYKTRVNLLRAPLAHDRERIVVVSWNGQVLLAGQVPSDGEKQKAEEVVHAVRHVVQVHNELQIAQPASFIARASDALITFRVKARLLFGPDVPGRRVKVVTENGVVYLMGLLTREESEQAVNAARNTYGVQKIVKIFEYITAPAADAASTDNAS